MAYATWQDVQALMLTQMSEDEQNVCTAQLERAALLIDAYNENASLAAKKAVSCNIVMRLLPVNGSPSDIPMGATQGSMSGLGYAQSWTISNGSVGEMYLSKSDKKLLGVGNKIGSYSPVEELARRCPCENDDYPISC